MSSLVPTCRRRATGSRRHHCSEFHQDLVESYRLARAAQEARAEAWALGYATELATFYREHEAPVTFRAWLLNSAGTGNLAVSSAAGGPPEAAAAEDFAA